MDMDDNVENDKKKKKKKKKIIIIVSIVIAVIVSILVAIAIIKLNSDENEIDEKTKRYENVVKDRKSIEKLSNFVSAGIFNDYGYKGLAYDFAKGIDNLTNNQKLQLVFQYLTNVQFVNEKINKDNIPEKYKNDKYISDNSIIMSILSSRTFEKEYEKFFGKAPTYDEKVLKELNVCPSVYKLDTRIKKIFLFNECNLDGDTLVLTKTYNYKFEDGYYYVYQYVGLTKKTEEGKQIYMKIKANKEVDVDDFYGNEDKFEKLIWKFDKNFIFISTTNTE